MKDRQNTHKFLGVLAMSLALLSSCGGTPTGNNSQGGGGGGGGEVVLPDFPKTPADKDSWEYLKKEDGSVEDWTIDWYVNDSSFSWNTYGSDAVSRVIKEKTGVEIHFTSPVTDDGQKLATLISGDVLPDLLSVQCWYPQCAQLASQGYLYPLDPLIDKWAPSFKPRIQEDMWKYFQQGDGYTYGVPNFAYSTKYISDSEKLQPNGGLLVREDWYKEVEAAGIDMTTPDGFIAGCEYVKAKHSGSIPFQIGPFTTDGNTSLDWLSQYFCCEFEDGSGNYVERRRTDNYADMMKFLNECYSKKLITTANLSDKADQIRTKISRGNVFASIVTPQDYQVAFQNCYSQGITYIPLVLHNYKGQAPILQDISGNGYLLTMVSKKCSRPDKVIKLLDFLYSEEGQRLVAFGIEGETYNWNADKTGIEWTPRYLSGIQNPGSADANWVASYGLYNMTLVMNLAYIEKLKPTNGMRDTDLYIDNIKRPLTPYSYNYKPIFLKHNTDDPKYFDIMTKNTKIAQKWSESLVKIMQASNYKSVLDSSLAYAKRQGLDEVVAFYSKSYQNTKSVLGVEWGWPANRPGYTEPTTGRNGDFSYWRVLIHE